jgi:glycosyltransferase involved in cell wall biosynthesis
VSRRLSGSMAASKDGGKSGLRVLIVRGSFASLGGAERELLQLIRATSQRWEVSLASLDFTKDAKALLDDAPVRLLLPENAMQWPNGAVAEIMAKASTSAEKMWRRMEIPWDTFDAVHISVCRGSLEILPLIPAHLPVHYHCLEPPRWLYEDVLHRHIDGTPKRPLWLTKMLFTRQRMRDKTSVKKLIQRPNSSISGNSMWIQKRLNAVYGLACDSSKENGEPPKRDDKGCPIEATHVMHVIDWSLWPKSPTKEEGISLKSIENIPQQYVVTIGRISHVKGTWETLQSLENTQLALVQVGGGDEADKIALLAEGKRIGVEVMCMPRLSQTQLCALIRGARAMVSHAHHEPFGLTPIEAMAIGVPALMVDEGGFACTMGPVDSGRLLARHDLGAWKASYLDAKDPTLRVSWAKAGRPYVEQHFTLEVQIAALERMLIFS